MTQTEQVKIPYKNNFLVVEQRGPYTLYVVRMEIGETPAFFKDRAYTNIDKAEEAATFFVSKEKLKTAK